MNWKLMTIFFFLYCTNSGLCVKILGIFPMPSKSHWILGSALMKELAKSGHEITVISPYPLKTPLANYTDIDITDLLIKFQPMTDKILEHVQQNKFSQYFQLTDGGFQIVNYTLYHPKVQKLMKSKQTFDLILLPIFMSEACLGFSHYYKAPLIAMSSFGISTWLNELLLAPSPPSYVPHLYLGFSDRMSFKQRLINAGMNLFEFIFAELNYNKKQSDLYNKIFPEPKPTLKELKKTAVSLALINNHISLNFPQPYMPNMIQIGGMHINRKPNALPNDIKEFIESSKNGVIYFAMGTNLKPSLFPKETIKALYNTLTNQKQRVLWLWNDPDSFPKHKNILISKWFPQDDILAHPNVRLFITHGGLLSCMESIYHGKPIVGIPVFADQKMNMGKVQQSGWGIEVNFHSITEKTLSSAIKEVIHNKEYKQKVAEASKRFRDQPLTPMENAKYWVEYVIRHKGAPHLHSAALDISFIEYYMLDVYGAFILILVLIFLFIQYYCCSKKKTIQEQNNAEIKKDN